MSCTYINKFHFVLNIPIFAFNIGMEDRGFIVIRYAIKISHHV